MIARQDRYPEGETAAVTALRARFLDTLRRESVVVGATETGIPIAEQDGHRFRVHFVLCPDRIPE